MAKVRKYPDFDAEEIGRQAKSVLTFLRYDKGIWIADEDKIIEDYVAYHRTIHEMYSGLCAYENYIYDKNMRIAKAIKQVKGKTYYRHFKNLLASLDRVVGVIQFSKTPKGDPQVESECGRSITEIWVDQRTVGMEGDSFAGTVSVQVKPGKFLIIPYEC